MSIEKDDDVVRPYVKRSVPFSYKSKEYHRWYYDNILLLKKKKNLIDHDKDST